MLRPLLYVLGTLLVTQAAVIATSVYLHRGLAHRALRLHPLADWVFRFVLWFTTGQNRREWVAVHRKHHAFTDTEKDPHSPLRARLLEDPALERLLLRARGPEPRDPRPLGQGHPGRHLGPRRSSTRAPSAAWSASRPRCWSWVRAGGCSLAVTHFILYVFVLAPSINGLGHWWGRKNFFNNSATNLRVLAWLTGGESLHNNHHAYPSSPKFSMGRFEFDPSWVVIRVLMLLRLARLVGDKVKLAA